MTSSHESILSEIERLQERRVKMEYKERRLFELSKGNPPPETVIEYHRIIEVDAANIEELQKKLERFYPVVV
jgi:hypothetical protein